jgi:Cd2+/Zn2+-exporting ATPase
MDISKIDPWIDPSPSNAHTMTLNQLRQKIKKKQPWVYRQLDQETGNEPVQSRTTLRVDGMCCASEVPIIHKMLDRLNGIENVSVDVLGKSATIVHFASISSPQSLADALNSAGLKSSIISCVLASADNSSSMRAAAEAARKHDKANAWPKWYVLLGFLGWMISLLHYIQDPPEFKSTKYVGLGSVALCIVPILKRSWGSLKMCLMDINTLSTIAVIGACLMEDYSEAAAVVVLFALSDWLSTRATARARNAVVALIALRPDVAVLAHDGTIVPVEDVQVGTLVSVRSGDKIPVDGTVETGTTSVNEANLTGESVPTTKFVGDGVHAGTINVGGGYLEIRSTSLSQDSAMSRLVQLVQQAQAETSPTEQLVMKIAKIYTPCVVLLSTLLATIPWAWGYDVGMEYLRVALVTLIIACPCALVISTPIAYVCGLAHAARVGILVKGGQHLETLGHIKVLALDKTGTLTTGRFELQHVEIVKSIANIFDNEVLDRDRVLSLLLTVESRASHPMSAALCSSAIAEGAKAIEGDVADFNTIKGEGICGTVDGHMLEVGNKRLLERVASLQISAEMTTITNTWEDVEGGTVGYFCMDGKLVASFSVSDSPRPEAKEAIEMLHQLGVATTMLTGDNEGSALAVQRATGVTKVHASLLPEDKTGHLKILRSDSQYKSDRCCGLTCFGFSFCGGKNLNEDAWIGMVGDGVNDAPALALATVGIAMGATGTVAVMETADVTLMDTDLRKLAKAVRLGRATVRKIRQNIVFSIITKLAVFGIALAGYPFLWLAIAADVGAMIAVTINSSTLLGRKKKVFGGMKGTSSHGHGHGGHGHDGADVCQHKRSNEGCQDGCCETKEVVADCADGCLFHGHGHGHGHDHGHGHGHGSTKSAPKSECAKGCCSTESKSAPAPKSECGRGGAKR